MAELKRILHVDDDEDIRAITRLALETVSNFEVCHCANGPDAVAMAEDFRPDLFLLDYMMPGWDGEQTANELHMLPSMGQVPVVYMTARVQGDVRAELLGKGAIGVIAKPFDPMALGEDLRRMWQDYQEARGRAAR